MADFFSDLSRAVQEGDDRKVVQLVKEALAEGLPVMPDNYIAFEYSFANPAWWYDIIDGLPNPIVKNGFIEVWDKPGLGVLFNKQAAKKYLTEEDTGFFD